MKQILRIIAISLSLYFGIYFASIFVSYLLGSVLSQAAITALSGVIFGIISLLVMTITVIFIAPKLNLKIDKYKANNRDVQYFIFGCVGIFVVLILINVFANIIGNDGSVQIAQETDYSYLSPNQQQILGLSSLLLALIVIPVVEEIIFRAVLYRGLRQKLTFILAALMSSAIFAGLHMPSIQLSQENLIIFVHVLLLSLVISYVYEKTTSIYTVISVHVVNNFVAIVFARLSEFYIF